MSRPQVALWLNGLPINVLIPRAAGELAWSHGADGGCLEASWKMDLSPTYAHPTLRRGSLVEIRLGPAPVWSGYLGEPDADDEWTFTAYGLRARGVDFLAFDPSLNISSKPDEAIDRAITAGIGWTRPTSLSNAAFSAATSTDPLFYVSDLLNTWSTSAGLRWGVNADREVYAAADPTTPTWHLTPGAGRFGLADDEYASDLFLRYVASSGVHATATVADTEARALWGRKEFPIDITGRGLITAPTATAAGNGLLAKGKARQGYTNGLEVSKYQLTTPGGTPATLALVRGQQLVRMFGVPSEQGQPTNYVDFVIGETHYEAGAETIGLTPVGLVPRTLSDVLADTA